MGKKFKIVEISWLDSTSLESAGVWRERDDVKKLKPVDACSVGYLIKESKEHITLAAHITRHHFTGEMCIPRACITETNILKEFN